VQLKVAFSAWQFPTLSRRPSFQHSLLEQKAKTRIETRFGITQRKQFHSFLKHASIGEDVEILYIFSAGHIKTNM
jgi:hypothetical protein